MKVCLKEHDYFTYRGVGSSRLELLGVTVYALMKERLSAEEDDGLGERVVLYPAYPFLTREKLFEYLNEREGSYSFPGGYVIRKGFPLSETPRKRSDALGPGLFSLSDYAKLLTYAARESACFWSQSGVLVEEGAEVSFKAKIGQNARIEKGAKVLGESVIGENALIGSGSIIEQSTIGADTVVRASVVTESVVGEGCSVGPNAYLRPHTQVGNKCRIGDFVELKNARVGDGTKISHLAYVGDAVLGEGVNVGCGVVFANFDGRKKSVTRVGDGCFIGSNCNLIAPVTIADHVFLAAGTTLTKNLEENDFCIGRARETVLPGRGKNYYSYEKR